MLDTYMQKEVERGIMKARARLVLGHPFYGGLILPQKMKVAEETIGDDGKPVKPPAIMTAGDTITYDPSAILDWNDPQLQGALAMAINPIARQHHVRRGDRDQDTWQRASE